MMYSSACAYKLAERLKLIDPDEMALCWVVDFPLFHYDEDLQRYDAEHNPFSGMDEEHMRLLDTDPLKVRAKQYDIICNGYEIGGGSVRINVCRASAQSLFLDEARQ